MSLKPRFISPIVAILLVPGLNAGAVAQQSDTEHVEVTLNDQLCGIVLSISGGDFGEWSWNGTDWVNVGKGDVISFHGQLYAPPQQTCTVSVTFNGLSDGASPPNVLTTTNFEAYSYFGAKTSRPPAGWFQENVSGTDYDFDYVLRDVPNTLPAGTYGGTIEINVVNSA